jgi:hypothetical protein
LISKDDDNRPLGGKKINVSEYPEIIDERPLVGKKLNISEFPDE